jgi:hypothetical protein
MLYIICELTMMLGAMQSPVAAAADLKRIFTRNSKRIDMLILIEKVEYGAESGGCLCDAHVAILSMQAVFVYMQLIDACSHACSTPHARICMHRHPAPAFEYPQRAGPV